MVAKRFWSLNSLNARYLSPSYMSAIILNLINKGLCLFDEPFKPGLSSGYFESENQPFERVLFLFLSLPDPFPDLFQDLSLGQYQLTAPL